MIKVNKNRKRFTSLVTVFVLLLLMLPASALFAATFGEKLSPPTQTTATTNKTTATTETTDTTETTATAGETAASPGETTLESENKSEQAIYVEQRNATAESLGIPSGQLNLLDKLAAVSGLTREEVLATWSDATTQDIMKEIQQITADGKCNQPGNTDNSKDTRVK